jgi:hypothetical protein
VANPQSPAQVTVDLFRKTPGVSYDQDLPLNPVGIERRSIVGADQLPTDWKHNLFK